MVGVRSPSAPTAGVTTPPGSALDRFRQSARMVQTKMRAHSAMKEAVADTKARQAEEEAAAAAEVSTTTWTQKVRDGFWFVVGRSEIGDDPSGLFFFQSPEVIMWMVRMATFLNSFQFAVVLTSQWQNLYWHQHRLEQLGKDGWFLGMTYVVLAVGFVLVMYAAYCITPIYCLVTLVASSTPLTLMRYIAENQIEIGGGGGGEGKSGRGHPPPPTTTTTGWSRGGGDGDGDGDGDGVSDVTTGPPPHGSGSVHESRDDNNSNSVSAAASESMVRVSTSTPSASQHSQHHHGRHGAPHGSAPTGLMGGGATVTRS